MDEGRFRVAKGHFLLLLICVLLLFLPISYAYADGDGASASIDGPWGEFWYGPNSFDSEGIKRWKTGIVAYTNWDAALYALGYSQSTIDGITNAQKVKLMSASTGGSYYTFAKGFAVGRPTEDAGNPVSGWNPSSMLTAWYAAKAMYGETYCYWQVYSDTLKNYAKTDANKIIKGGSESGGGESGGGGQIGQDGSIAPGTYVAFTLDKVSTNASGTYPDYQSGTLDVSSGYAVVNGASNPVTREFGDTLRVGVPSALWNEFYNRCIQPNGYDKLFVGFRFYNNNNYVCLYGYNSNLCDVEKINTGFRFARKYSTSQNCFGFAASYECVVLKGTVYATGNRYNVNNAALFSVASRDVQCWYSSDYANGDTGTGDGDDEPEPPEWPKPPADPPVPVLPPPGDPVTPVDPPDPTPPDPTVDPPTDPWVPWTPEVDTSTGTDIQAILDAMNEHCIHLQNAIEYNVEQLYELQRTYLTDNFSTVRDAINDNFNALADYLKDAFDWLGNDVIVASFTDLKDYLNELFGWLSDTLNVSTESYDDTSVLYWLRQIWGKLGGGISVKPVDPSIDNDGWWDWFANLLGGLIGALADIGLDKIGGLVDALDTLKDKFPFCIPWDIAALLGLLVSEPVTPVVQVPLMALSVSNGVQEVGTMTVDLTAYDDVWDAVRWIERIAFCVYLATRTKDFLDLLGKIKG